MRTRRPVRISLLLLLLSSLFAPAVLAEGAPPLTVYYAGPDGGTRTALTLAADIRLVSDPAQADVLVLNGAIPDPEGLAARVREGTGLLLILGLDLTANEVSTLIGLSVALEAQEEPLSPVAMEGVTDPVLSEILWTSAPQVRQRYKLTTPVSALTPLVVGFEDGSYLLVGLGGRAFIFSAFPGGPALQPHLSGAPGRVGGRSAGLRHPRGRNRLGRCRLPLGEGTGQDRSSGGRTPPKPAAGPGDRRWGVGGAKCHHPRMSYRQHRGG